MPTFAEVIKRLELVEQRNTKLEAEVKQLRADAQKAGTSSTGSKAVQAQRSTSTGSSYGEQLSAKAGFFDSANPIKRQWQGLRQKGIDSAGAGTTMGYLDTLSQMSKKGGAAGAIGIGAGVANKMLGAAAGTMQAFADHGALAGEILKVLGSAAGMEVLGKMFGEITGIMAGEARKFFAEIAAKFDAAKSATEARDARIRMGGKDAVLQDLDWLGKGGGKTHDAEVDMQSNETQFQGAVKARAQTELFKKKMERNPTLGETGQDFIGHAMQGDISGAITDVTVAGSKALEDARKNLFAFGGKLNQSMNDFKKMMQHVGG